MVAYLEHANITVPDIDAAIAFLKVVEPAFTVRHDASPAGSYRWAHIGTDQSYIALQEPHVDATPQQAHRPYKDYGVNHLGWGWSMICKRSCVGLRNTAIGVVWRWRRISIGNGPIITMRRVLNGRSWNTYLTGQKKGIRMHNRRAKS